jgi:hypothetical protein
MALYIEKGSRFEATVTGFVSGLVGTLGVRVLDNVGGTTIPRTTSGIIELAPGSGSYAATLNAPAVPGDYTILWDDTQTGPQHNAAEDLIVVTTTTVQVGTGTAGMTFGQILDDVLDNPLRFEADLRPRAGRAVNMRYAHVWGLEDWTFRFATCFLDVPTGGGPLAPEVGDFGTPLYLWDSNGNQLVYMGEEEFVANYSPLVTPGVPAAWTVIAGQILLAPAPTAGTFTCYYRRRLSQLVGEDQYPMLPPEYHLMLVHGGRAELLSVSDDPMTAMMEDQFSRDIEAMKREYLIDAIGQPAMWPTDLNVVG